MIDVSERHLSMVKDIFRRHVPECELRVFGSRITGKAKPYSDLDVALVGADKIPLKVFFAMKEDFSESDIPFRVDILDWNAISAEFRAVIEKKYEVLPLD